MGSCRARYSNMMKAFKYRLYPTKKEQGSLAMLFGSARFVYNHALASAISTFEKENKHTRKYDLIKELVPLKRQYAWLSKSDSQVLQQSVTNVDRAFSNFFAQRAGFPQFK